MRVMHSTKTIDGRRMARWTNYEVFGFADGDRLAWVTYEAEMPDGVRRCVGVTEAARPADDWAVR